MIACGVDVDGIAQTETGHFGNCPVCGVSVDIVTWRTFMMLRSRLAKAQRRRGVRSRCSNLQFDTRE